MNRTFRIRAYKRRAQPARPDLGVGWTSVSDIGEEHDLTAEDYLSVEDKMVQLVMHCLEEANIERLNVSEIELTSPVAEAQLAEGLPDVLTELGPLTASDIPIRLADAWIRANLRELIWSKLGAGERLYVHFGYDYQIYIGGPDTCEDLPIKARELGLFVDEFPSPYLNSSQT